MAIADRRPIKARSLPITEKSAKWLSQYVSANQVSIASVICSVIAVFFMIGGPGIVGATFAVLFLIGRLVCNLLDGMIAVENGKKTFDGILYNEIPDRISDMITFIALGMLGGTGADLILGALVSGVAVTTAAIRYLGSSIGQPMDFSGYGQKSYRIIGTAGIVFISGIMTTIGSDTLVPSFVGLGLLVLLGMSIQTCYIRLINIRARMKQTEIAEKKKNTSGTRVPVADTGELNMSEFEFEGD